MNMHTSSPTPYRVAAAVIVPVLFVLVGAGCYEAGQQLANEAVTPVTTAVNAVGKTVETLAEQKAKQYLEAEMASDDVSVAFIVTEGSEAPMGAELTADAIGCNDRVAYKKIHRAAATDSVVHDALMTLFTVKEPAHEGLYNSLAQSTLTVDTIKSPDGVTTEVWLKGSVASSGACDDPRIKAQIEHTIGRFRPKHKVYLNGSEAEYRCLGDQSGECK